MKPLNAGIIGLGVGERHIAGYEAHSGCKVTALCDQSRGKLAEVAKRHPGRRLTTRAADILRDPDIQVVSIASYDNFHKEQVCEAVRRGKHVFVEKPLCLDRREAAAIRKALDARPRVRMSSNLILRMSPRFIDLKARVRRGDLGAIYYSEGDYNYGRIHKITEGWRGRIPYYSVMCGGGVHMIDTLLWTLGTEVEEVSAYGTRIATRGTRFKHPDCVSALLKLKKHGIAKVVSNYSCVYPHHHLVSLYGTRGTFTNGLEGGRVITSRDPKARPETLKTAYPGSAKGDLIPSFVRSILGEGRAGVDAEDIFRVMSVCFAADESVAKGRPVKVRSF